MTTIYDDILIVNNKAEDSADTFLGQGGSCILTQETITIQDNLKVAEQKKWLLESVEAEIVKAAKEGKYSTNINIPSDYSLMDIQQFLVGAGYTVTSQSSTNRTITIGWNIKMLEFTIHAKLYTDKDTWTGYMETITNHIPQGTLINKEFIKNTFRRQIETMDMVFELQTEGYNEFEQNAGPGLTNIEELNTVALANVSVTLPYLKITQTTE